MDLTVLFRNIVDFISVDEVISFSREELKDTEIETLENISVVGKIKKDSSLEIVCDLTVSGNMELKDSISNELISYPFSFQIDENIEEFIEKDKNFLAFRELLWENIVLEVPIRYTKVKDYKSYQGDGWRLTSEEDITRKDNPFQELLNQEKRSE